MTWGQNPVKIVPAGNQVVMFLLINTPSDTFKQKNQISNPHRN